MTEYSDKIITKAKSMYGDVMDCMGTLLSINKLFSFGNEKTFLKREGFNKLTKIGLLRRDGGHCSKCNRPRNLVKHSRADGLLWKCTKCKCNTLTIRHKSIFFESRKSLYVLLAVMRHCTFKSRSKNVVSLLECDSKTVADWYRYLRNAMTRLLLKIDIKLGGPGKRSQADETHFFKIPKNHRGRFNRTRNWLMVCVEEESTLFYCQLIRKKTRPALETIINECIKPGTHISTDEHKSYHWLGKTTNNRTYQPSRPALYTHSTVCHKREFKAADGTHTNVVEGQNSLIKGPYKAMKGLPRYLIPMYLDQLMFEGWTNSVLPYSKTSNSQSEKEKVNNVLVMFVSALSELYCLDASGWKADIENFVSDGAKIVVDENLYDYYKDQGYATNDNDLPIDDIYNEDLDYDETYYENEEGYLYDESHFDFEADNSDDSDYSEA